MMRRTLHTVGRVVRVNTVPGDLVNWYQRNAEAQRAEPPPEAEAPAAPSGTGVVD